MITSTFAIKPSQLKLIEIKSTYNVKGLLHCIKLNNFGISNLQTKRLFCKL